MARKHRWVWVLLFIGVVLLLGTLATGWNVVLVRDYRKLIEIAHGTGTQGKFESTHSFPLWQLTFGTLGFLAALTGTIVFFVKLLKEMSLNQAQTEFLATVSHELKTPIAAIELSASLLQAGVTPQEQEKLWSSLNAELKRLKSEVETLLEAARLQIGEIAPKIQVVKLEEWIQDSLPRWRHLLGAGARLQRAGDPFDFNASTDTRLLNLIADNLIDNARKFAREGKPEVVIETRKNGHLWQVRIQDRGWGFDPQDTDRIFRRFFRSRTAAPYAIPGTGLGLFLAANAGHSLKLALSAESEGHGRGATFTIEGSLSETSP